MPAEAHGGEPRPAQGVLGVGVAVLDLVFDVASYPAEDDELRALAQRRVRGGNVTNSLVVLSHLGHRCRWVGTLGDDPAANSILADLAHHEVQTDDVVRVRGGATPTSVIWVSRATGSRTIVHARELPELSAEDFRAVALDDLGWVHFEGRHPAETARMIARVRDEAPHLVVSVELEKPRLGMDALLVGPDLLLASRAYAHAAGFSAPEPFLEDLAAHSDAARLVVAWGAQGAAYLERGGRVQRIPAHVPRVVVETLGAGDVFNAGVIHGLMHAQTLHRAVADAVLRAGRKCERVGLV